MGTETITLPAGGEGPVERHAATAQRIAQVLEHVAVDDRVEGALEQRRRRLQVGDHHLLAAPARPRGQRRVALERGHAPALPR